MSKRKDKHTDEGIDGRTDIYIRKIAKVLESLLYVGGRADRVVVRTKHPICIISRNRPKVIV